MIDPKRLRGIVAAAAGVAVALAACSLLAHAAAGGRPAWLAGGDSTIEGGQDAIVGGRIAGVSAEQRHKGAKVEKLGVLLGASAIGTDVDPKLLAAEGGPGLPKRWLNLNANGANLDDLRDLSDLLLGSGLEPEVIVLGIHPGLLARSDKYLSDSTTFDFTGLKKEFAGRSVRGVQAEVESLASVPVNAAFPNRSRINYALRGVVSDLKRRGFASIGLGASALYAPDPDPWAVRELIPGQAEAQDVPAEGRNASVRDQATGPMFEGVFGAIRDKGWSDPGSYSVDGRNAKALIAMIRDARARGIEVKILILPERSDMRASVAPEATRCLRESLKIAFDGEPPPVIDLGDAMPDELFHDKLHLARQGQVETTRKLLAALRVRLPSR